MSSCFRAGKEDQPLNDVQKTIFASEISKLRANSGSSEFGLITYAK